MYITILYITNNLKERFFSVFINIEDIFMLRILLIFIAVFMFSSCSSNKDEACGFPLYSDEYYNNVNVNADFPCIVDTCGNRICNSYEDEKSQYRNYYTSEQCNQK